MHRLASVALIVSALFCSVAAAQSTPAVEWKVSDGGNGHWYARVERQSRSWSEMQAAARVAGGHLATLTSAAENGFAVTVMAGERCLSGGYQDRSSADYSEPAGGWKWVTGEAVTFSAWAGGEPNEYWPWGEDIMGTYPSGQWVDLSDRQGDLGWPVAWGLVEWSADCNGDGVVDYGQIRSGQLSDDNTNGIPDICETSITGVIPPSVPAQGGSAISINGRNFPAQPTVLVGGVAATNVVRVSETRLTATTPALLPGMASVSVNGFTLADGIYIRPECGSDLDQDGEVTASDIAIVLLDFGPCYATATSSQPVDSTPFLLKEEPDSGTPGAR